MKTIKCLPVMAVLLILLAGVVGPVFGTQYYTISNRYIQHDPIWAQKSLLDVDDHSIIPYPDYQDIKNRVTMYTSGCAVSSIAMVIETFSRLLEPTVTVTPLDVLDHSKVTSVEDRLVNSVGDLAWDNTVHYPNGNTSVRVCDWDFGYYLDLWPTREPGVVEYIRQHIDQRHLVVVEVQKIYKSGEKVPHFVVAYGHNGDRIYIMDPYYNGTVGISTENCTELQQHWEGKDGDAKRIVTRVICYTPLLTCSPGEISGYKWNDLNENGNWDSGEPGLSDWTIQLYKDGAVVASTTTAADGSYKFSDLSTGSYEVKEVLKDGWKITYPTSNSHSVSIDCGTTEANVNFGNFEYGKIGAMKFRDTNINGRNDEGSKLSGWEIDLYKDGVFYDKKTTDSNGTVVFDKLGYGQYDLYERTKADWRQTEPFPGKVDVVDAGELGLGVIGSLLVTSGSEYMENVFGNVQLGSVTKLVRHYWWKYPIKGITVYIEEVDVTGILGNVPALPLDGITGEDGKYKFGGLLPGTYKITIDLPDGWCEEPVHEYDTAIVCEGEDYPITNEIYDNPCREPRTKGFWQNWQHRYSKEEMQDIITRIQTGSEDFADLSLDTIDGMISPRRIQKVTIRDMMRMQYLAMWLNLASERLGFTSKVDISGISNWNTVVDDVYGEADGVMTIHCLMKQLRDKYNNVSMNQSQIEVFKNICDSLNNYKGFLNPPTGPID